MEEQLEEEEQARQKLMLDKVNVDQRWKKLEEKHAELADSYEKACTSSKKAYIRNDFYFALSCTSFESFSFF